jgi:hypothetical protein
MYTNMIQYNLDPGTNTGYKNAAAGYIHYIHGVNPTAFAYISNMGSYGAENSINEFYHSWFTDGSALWDRKGSSTYGPAPGFIPGGPNKYYNRDNCCNSSCGSPTFDAMCNTSLVTPPLSQPPQKSYKDWNTSWPQNSWEVTENGIYYNASYIRLLAHFSCIPAPLGNRKEIKEDHLKIYPNPNNGTFTLELSNTDDEITEVNIYNTLGVKIPSEEISAGANSRSIKLDNAIEGIYYMEIKAGERSVIKKMVLH